MSGITDEKSKAIKISINKDNIEVIDFDEELSNKKIYIIPRLDRCIDSKIIKSQRLNNNLFSTQQDAWLFKTPLLLNKLKEDLKEKLD